jgi:putative FmdB family regulatory protein
MPIYEYECLRCLKIFDALQSIKDSPLKRCPACGHNKVRKRPSIPVVHTKSRSSIVPRLLPEFAGDRLVLDGTRPDSWPGGYAFGVRKNKSSEK